MTSNPTNHFNVLLDKAVEYHNSARWEEKLRALHEALHICETQDFPDSVAQTRKILVEISGIYRRMGRYLDGITTLEELLQRDLAGDVAAQAKIVGEIGIMHRHSNDHEQARKLFMRQFELASQDCSLEAEAQMCQGIGNAGMTNYSLATQQTPHDADLLSTAVGQLHERVDRARKLQKRVLEEGPKSTYFDVSKQWETIGMNRLILCYIRMSESDSAVRQAEDTLRHQHTQDPNVRAFTAFFCGYAFWFAGQHQRAVQLWKAPPRTTTSAMAFCKEASKEHVTYLRLLADAGLAFDSYDEQGSTALDFAVLSESSDAKVMVDIILGANHEALMRRERADKLQLTEDQIEHHVSSQIKMQHRQALLRREYRSIFQEHIRPAILENGSINSLRYIYANLLEDDAAKTTVLDSFHYIKFDEFRALGRMPTNGDQLAKVFGKVDRSATQDSQFVVFLSYRQLGMTRTPPRPGPDDDNQTQYRRMISAIEALLTKRQEIDAKNLGMWLDCACIDQIDSAARERGINALPFAVALCDAMISLTDETYWTRAWCAMEVRLMQVLQKSTRIHSWFEHKLHDRGQSRIFGHLEDGDLDADFDVSDLKLTNEELDRPKIDFLLRQSLLIGKEFSK